MTIHLIKALEAVELHGRDEVSLVPSQPTEYMIEAAMKAARLDRETVRAVYAAMLDAYEEDQLPLA